MDFAHVVAQSRHLEPVALWVDHPPRGEVVNRGSPEDGLLAASVHGDVAADTGGVSRGRVHRKDQASGIGCVGDSAGHDAGPREDGRNRLRASGQWAPLDRSQFVKLFGVDDDRLRGERDRTTGVASAAPPGNDGETEFNRGLHQARNLRLRIRREHHQWELHSPIRGIGHMGHARESIEFDVVRVCQPRQAFLDLPSEHLDVLEILAELPYCGTGQRQQCLDLFIALGRLGVSDSAFASTVDVLKSVMQGLDQRLPAFGVREQIILQVRVALHGPDVSEDLVEHLGRTACLSLPSELIDQDPALLAQEATDDLLVGE